MAEIQVSISGEEGAGKTLLLSLFLDFLEGKGIACGRADRESLTCASHDLAVRLLQDSDAFVVVETLPEPKPNLRRSRFRAEPSRG